MIASLRGRLAEVDADGLIIEVWRRRLARPRLGGRARAARDIRRRCSCRPSSGARGRAHALRFASQRERGLVHPAARRLGARPGESARAALGALQSTRCSAASRRATCAARIVSGIGKRTAERIVVELREELGAAALEAVEAGGASAPRPTTRTSRRATRSSRSASPCARPRPRWPTPRAAPSSASRSGSPRCGAGARYERGRAPRRCRGVARRRGRDRPLAAAAPARRVRRPGGRARASRDRARSRQGARRAIDHVLLAGPPGSASRRSRTSWPPRWIRG